MTSSRLLFQVIDFDRTLFDTSKFAKLVTQEVDVIQPGLGAKLDEQFEIMYKRRETFFLFHYLRSEIGNERLEALAAHIVDKVGVDALLMPGARERIAFAERIATQRPGWGILTYGDAEDQHMKLRLAGFGEAPTILLETPNKSEAIATWKNDDGTFTLPKEFGGATVTDITLEDDKLRAFYDIPAGVTGVWMKNAQNELVEGEVVPEGVVGVYSLLESIEYLEEKFA